jgi:hypothetical protein
MREFRKTKDGLFICEECGSLCVSKSSLSAHVKIHNVHKKIYYDKWLKENDEGLCKICKNKTEFVGFARSNGYKPYCSKECINKGRYMQTCIGNKKLYGVENSFQREDVKQYIKEICLKKYGVEYTQQSLDTKNKIKQTCIKKYGVEHNMQNREIFEKQQMSAFKAKKYKNTSIYYRGSYELNLLEQYYNNYPEIQNGPTIKYAFKNKQHFYFSDFYIASLNLIIEVKSSYYYNKYKDLCEAKQKATITNGFNYIIVKNKDYNELNLFLKSS